MNDNTIESNNNNNLSGGGIPTLGGPDPVAPAAQPAPAPAAAQPAPTPAAAQPAPTTEPAPAAVPTPVEEPAPAVPPVEPVVTATQAEPAASAATGIPTLETKPVEPITPVSPVAPTEPTTPADGQANKPTEAKPKNKKGLIIGLICGLVAVVVIAVVVIVFVMKPGSEPEPAPKQQDLSGKNTVVDEEEPEEEEPDDSDLSDLAKDYKKAQETIKRTEGSSNQSDLEDRTEAMITEMLYYFESGEVDELVSLLPQIKEVAAELTEVSGGEYDTSTIEQMVEAIEQLETSLSDPSMRAMIEDSIKNGYLTGN